MLEQTFPDFELLIIDDGSTDNTREVVASFTDKRIIYTYQENKERSASRNKGMSLARGRYIAFLDSDDLFYPAHLQVLYDAITGDNCPVAIYKTMMHYGDKSRPDDFSYAYTGEGAESAVRYVWSNGSQLICLAFHREIADTVRFPEPFFWFEDIHWITRVALKFPLRQVQAHTTYYMKSDGHFHLNGHEKYLLNGEACIRNLEDMEGVALKKILGEKCFDIKVAELYLGLVVGNAIREKNLRLAQAYLRRAVHTCITPRLLAKYVYYQLRILKAIVF